MNDNNTLDGVKAISLKQIIASETGQQFNSHKKLPECPFCGSGSGKNGTPAFTLYPEQNIFKCFSCGKAGNPIEFIKYLKGLESPEAIKYLKSKYNEFPSIIPVQKSPEISNNNDKFSKVSFAIKQNAIEPALEYLGARGIPKKQIKEGTVFYDKLDQAVAFIDSTETLINKRMINPVNGQKSKHVKGSILNNAIYDFCFDPDQDTIYITEGVINGLSMSGRSFISIFSTSNSFSDPDKLKKYLEKKEVVLAFDNDPAGDRCTEYYRDFILKNEVPVESLSRLIFPEGKDMNDLLQEGKGESHIRNHFNYMGLLPDTKDETRTPLHRNSENPDQDYREFQFYTKDGCYYTNEHSRSNKSVTKRLSNFTMTVLYHFIDGTNNTRRLLKLQRYTGEIHIIEVLSSDLTLERFETILKSHSCTFLGSTYQLKLIISRLMDDQQEAIAINQLGYHEKHDIYCLSNCIITNNGSVYPTNRLGIKSLGAECFYLPAWAESNLINKSFDEQRQFRFKNGNLDFKQWSMHLYTAYGIKGGIGILFLIMAMFRDIVYKELGFFPFLFLYGQPGVGKSSFIDFILRVFGDKNQGVSISNSTIKGISRSCTQVKNAIVFLKEYDNSIKQELIAFFKNAYDGTTYTIAQKSSDNKTDNFDMESAVIIDGNVLPTSESAMFDRMMILYFEKNKFSEESSRSYKILVDESEEGLGQVLLEILQCRQDFQVKFKPTYRKVLERLKSQDNENSDLSISQLPERTIKHTAFLLTPLAILKDSLVFPFQFEELLREVLAEAIEKNTMLDELKETSVFWDAFNHAMTQQYQTIQENVHFKLDTDDWSLLIKIDVLYPFYADYCRKNSIRQVGKSTIRKQLTSLPSFIPGNQKGRGVAITKNGFGSCYKFSYSKAEGSNNICIDNKEIQMNHRTSNSGITM